jgi:chaperonin GroES
MMQPRLAPEKIGGLFLPERARQISNEGNVLAVGQGKLLKNGMFEAIPVEPGDHVIFDVLKVQRVSIEGHDLLIIDADYIEAIVTDEESNIDRV